jgi:hypothetical protein
MQQGVDLSFMIGPEPVQFCFENTRVCAKPSQILE